MRKRWLSLLSAGLFVAVVSPVLADGMTEKRISDGHSIYQLTCSVCHGDKGDGKTWATRALDPSPEDFTAEPEHFNMETLMDHIAEGCHDTAMQPFKYQLYEQEIEAVSAHILVNLLGWRLAEVNADVKGEPHGRHDQDSDGDSHDHQGSQEDKGSHDHKASHDEQESHADKGPHDDDDSHADGEGCRPWNLEGVKTVAIKGRKP